MKETPRLPIFKPNILLEPPEVEISNEKFTKIWFLLQASLLRAPYEEHGAQLQFYTFKILFIFQMLMSARMPPKTNVWQVKMQHV